MNLYDVIKKPVITESSMAQLEAGKYVFEVDTRAHKLLIKQAVEAAFEGVKVANVNTINVKPKAKRVGRYTGFTNKTKKAIITLTADSKAIEIVGIRVYKPTTNGRRNMTSLDFAEITTSTPEKSLLVALKSKAGRNNNGRITVRHQGGGHKRFYRLVDFKRNKDNVEAVVKTIEYDPNRSANIALVHYTDGVKAYIIGSTYRFRSRSRYQSRKRSSTC